ncbi:MAG: Txe/YoeB family addiction module toxin [Acidobacteriia bacterium]|nr:Txe/YoeB family addiction module toxin [Terriglobia bacterium]
MVKWKLVYTRQALKDAKRISAADLKEQVIELLRIVEADPFQVPPPYEKLMGDLTGAYSRRINVQHRLVYQVFKKERVVKIIRLWTHYE